MAGDENTELADAIADYVYDPYGYVMFVFPWDEGGLSGYHGPRKWQKEFLQELGCMVRERGFNGVEAVMPVLMAVSSGHGIGKAQDVDDVIDTPDGRKRFGDLMAGSRVFGRDGTPVNVTGIPYRGVRPFYRVTFDDGSFLDVAAEHEWMVKGRNERRTGGNFLRLETQEILRRGVRRKNGTDNARNWSIPVQGAAVYPYRGVGFDPYAVGVWLGDGDNGSARVTNPDDNIRRACHGGEYGADGTAFTIPRLIDYLKGQGLRGKKRVPQELKENSIEVRRQVLAGLLDTDGDCCAGYSVEFSNTEKQLCEDVLWLARSLGYKARLSDEKPSSYKKDGFLVQCKPHWRVRITPHENPFRASVKADRWRKPSQERYFTRWIDSIEPIGDRESMCISVDGGLYQARDFIVTHNSALTAWIIKWIMDTRPHAKGTITANTSDQLKTKTWAELGKWHKLSLTRHLFEWHGSKGNLSFFHPEHRETWRCDGITCREENSESFAGQHNASSTSFYLFDEASAVPDKIYEVAQGGLTDGEPMWFVFGNPTRNEGMFRRIFGNLKHRWWHRQIDSRTVEGTSKELLEEWVADHGEDSDFVRVRVRGMFPRASSLQFIDSDTVAKAMKAEPHFDEHDALVCGLDVARGGNDSNVLFFRRGMDAKSIPPLKIAGHLTRNTTLLVAKVTDYIKQHGPVEAIFVDSTGIGGPIADRLRQLNYPAIDVTFGGEAPEKHRFVNMAAFMWWKMREALQLGLALAPDVAMESQLTNRDYTHDVRDRLLLESKKELAKRGLESPDDADALALTYAMPVARANAVGLNSISGLNRGAYAHNHVSGEEDY